MNADDLRAARKATGLSQADFAARLGLSRDYVGMMERGLAPIKPRTVDAVRHIVPATAKPQKNSPQTNDPMERLVELALIEAGINYVTDRDGGNASNLDFRLPDYGVEIEVKRFHSDRISEQMARAPNVIALQGEASIRLFADMIRAMADQRNRAAHR